jgi:hypothetical protein
VEGGADDGYTRTHQVLIRVSSFGDAKEIAMRLEKNNVITNYQALPDDETFYRPSGIRMGVQEMTRFGMKEQDFDDLARLMAAVVQNLKKQRAFYRAYHAETGAGLGERNPVHGLAPLGLFLQTLGVEVRSPRLVALSGKNPFPWPVTVKYRGLTVTRQMEQTTVTFPDGRTVTLDDPTEALVAEE